MDCLIDRLFNDDFPTAGERVSGEIIKS